jgi:hypothetical protein
MTVTEIKRTRSELSRRGNYKPSIIYVWPKGESLMENLQNRRERPYTAYKKMLQPLFAELGISANAKLAWNQRAGCSCPCSPGFFIKVDGRPITLLERNEFGFATHAYNLSITVE